MGLFYLGNSPKHLSLESDYYLSPVMTPDELLTEFPPIFFLTGEKDPFVDDTLIFSARLRAAQVSKRGRKAAGRVRVQILEGISHGFMQFLSLLPLVGEAVKLTAGWINELFEGLHVGESSPGEMMDSMHKRRRELASRHLS